MRALALQFASGADVLSFYEARAAALMAGSGGERPLKRCYFWQGNCVISQDNVKGGESDG